MKRLIAPLLILALAGCKSGGSTGTDAAVTTSSDSGTTGGNHDASTGGNNDASTGGNNDSGTTTTTGCTMTFSGPITASISCNALGLYSVSDSKTTYAINGMAAAGISVAAMSADGAGVATAGDKIDSSTTWMAAVLAGSNAFSASGPSGTGTGTIHVTSVTLSAGSGTNNVVYTLHGTADATIPPAAGSGDSLTMHADF